jgi:hypothetical protein
MSAYWIQITNCCTKLHSPSSPCFTHFNQSPLSPSPIMLSHHFQLVHPPSLNPPFSANSPSLQSPKPQITMASAVPSPHHRVPANSSTTVLNHRTRAPSRLRRSSHLTTSSRSNLQIRKPNPIITDLINLWQLHQSTQTTTSSLHHRAKLALSPPDLFLQSQNQQRLNQAQSPATIQIISFIHHHISLVPPLFLTAQRSSAAAALQSEQPPPLPPISSSPVLSTARVAAPSLSLSCCEETKKR